MGQHLLRRHRSAQLLAHRRHAFTHNAAGNDVFEPRQICTDVEGQAVRRDVAAAMDPWSTEHSVYTWLVRVETRLTDQEHRAQRLGLIRMS